MARITIVCAVLKFRVRYPEDRRAIKRTILTNNMLGIELVLVNQRDLMPTGDCLYRQLAHEVYPQISKESASEFDPEAV